MDKSITARLYRIERDNDQVPRFVDVLQQIDNIDGLKKREKTLATGFTVRLEFLEIENSHIISGEMLRIQSTNYPSEVTENKRTAISVKNRLGHSIVFRVNHHKGLLGVQYDPRVCGPGRLFSYLQEFHPEAQYKVLPIVREDAWKRFGRTKPRKVQIKVASPTSLAALQGGAQAAGSAIASMGRAYGAPKISVEISMGHSHGYLKSAKELVSGLLSASDDGSAELEKLRVFGEDEEKGIDFLQELLVFRDELEFHERDPDVNFAIRRDYLKRVMLGHS